MNPSSLPSGVVVSRDEKLGCDVLAIQAKCGAARIALHGATLLSFTPATGPSAGRDLLWLSSNTSGAEGKAIRGGVPICGPWFGPHPVLPTTTSPLHGLLRLHAWDLVHAEALSDGSVRVELSTTVPADKERGWPHHVAASFTVKVAEALTMELSLRNIGTTPFVLTNALHTYFAVSDVRNVHVEGLEGREYIDFTGGGARRRHGQGKVTITQESARFFLSSSPVRLVDPGLGRAITVSGWGFSAIPVWNPWDSAITKMPDIGSEWPGFICIESANTADVGVPLPPSMSHHLGVTLTAEAL